MGERYHNATSSIVLGSIEDVDNALKEIGTLELAVKAIDAAAEKKVQKIKEDAKAKGEESRMKIQELAAKIEAFADLHSKELFRDGKTKVLPFGSFGYRQSTKTSTKRDTLEKLKNLCTYLHAQRLESKNQDERDALEKRLDGLTACIDVVEKLNKTNLRNIEAGDQKTIGVKVIVEDSFFCESKSVKVNQELMKRA